MLFFIAFLFFFCYTCVACFWRRCVKLLIHQVKLLNTLKVCQVIYTEQVYTLDIGEGRILNVK